MDSPLEMRCVALDAYHERLGAGEQELLPQSRIPGVDEDFACFLFSGGLFRVLGRGGA